MDTGALAVDAFAQLNITARTVGAGHDGGVDLVLDLHGVETPVQLKRRPLVTEDSARRLCSQVLPTLPADVALIVVSDRVTAEAGRVLTRNQAGYLDLRGRLVLHTPHVVIDAQVEPVTKRPERSDALSGKVGLEVATALLMEPNRPTAVRALARQLQRSPSTVSEVLKALRAQRLIDRDNSVLDKGLFWEVADRWPTARVPLASPPRPGDASNNAALKLGLEDPHAPGWALTDSAAAAAYGAPIAFRTGQVLDFFVPDQSIVRRATTLLGGVEHGRQARATIRVAPVPAAVTGRVDLPANPLEWPLTHPLFVALDLAQDTGRGREILAGWTPEGRWTRVW
ncbi:ArsR family transcriptional regulator [Intrasporangium calvum]|uniref:ArsR family transcriptional regulator n=1 Tax=Intrasporangium calvum TaxID=53358 RepID=UPI000DF6022C|nr:ArsR family transcriptional regulator [Intrasporangium calvum]AXG14541.1 ArsR family transcriptional regulator [Intrasporangium calvum]